MTFPWTDPIVGQIADIVTIVGMPLLVSGIWKLVTEIRQERALRHEIKGVTQDCLEFFDLRDNVAITLVPLARATFLPRPGDAVSLPEEEPGGLTRGDYEVERLSFVFVRAPELDNAAPLKVIAYVKRRDRQASKE